MSALDRQRTQQEARQAAGDVRRATPYSEAVNRYLGACGYPQAQDTAAVPAPHRPDRTGSGIVLVGVDDSAASNIVVDHATIEAELRGWDLRLVHVQQPGTAQHPARDLGARLLERLTDRVHGSSSTVAVTSRLVIGAPDTALLSAAEHADLVVVGHRHGVVGAVLGWAVGDRVATGHPGTVLVVRVPGRPPGPELGIRPIVVGAGTSPTSPRTIAFAWGEAKLRGCELTVLHATGDDPAPADRVENRDGVIVRHWTVPGDPVTALRAASKMAAAVVVGRHSGRHVTDAPLGSVGRALLQRVDCPVFLVGGSVGRS